jgi:hypothetical protein
MHSLTEPRPHVCTELDRESEEVLKLKMKSRQIKKAPPVLHVDEQVDIAARAGRATDHRPVDADV